MVFGYLSSATNLSMHIVTTHTHTMSTITHPCIRIKHTTHTCHTHTHPCIHIKHTTHVICIHASGVLTGNKSGTVKTSPVTANNCITS